MPTSITLTGDSLTIDHVVAVARGGAEASIDPAAADRAERSRAVVQEVLEAGEPVYGVNTGFGKLANVRIPVEQIVELQRNLIVSHTAGVGDPLPVDVVRAIMLLRANVLLMPTSGVRPILAQCLVDMLNAGIHPTVPEQGSVGASGDLAPLAHIGLAVIGEGEVHVTGKGKRETRKVSASEALRAAGIEPVEFQAKEGLAFINGTQAQSAILALSIRDARNLWRTAVGAAAMSLDALMGTPVPFDERIHRSRPHPGQSHAAKLLRELLADSEIRDSHRDDDPRVQDAYSLRCTPQIVGPVYDAIEHAGRVVDIELNAATDNPLVFGKEMLSGGNFHGQAVALALDILGIALVTLAGVSERRLDRLMNADLSQGLPPFLSPHAGLHSGFMMVQVTAAALVAESRTLATPASVQSIPTEANQEDFVPMGMAAAVKVRRILANARRTVACELLAAAQGLEFRRPLSSGRGVERLCERVRELVPPLTVDRPLTPDIEKVAALVAEEALV